MGGGPNREKEREGGRTNERSGTDHVTSGPGGASKKTTPDGANRHPDRQTRGHGDSMTESAQWGLIIENQYLNFTRFT